MNDIKHNDGGPAFPRPPVKIQRAGKSYCEYVDGQEGMSLRDWFAGMALKGLLSGQFQESSKWNLSEAPEEAFKIADGMLKAREKGVPAC